MKIHAWTVCSRPSWSGRQPNYCKLASSSLKRKELSELRRLALSHTLPTLIISTLYEWHTMGCRRNIINGKKKR